jgi:hypothetical protein
MKIESDFDIRVIQHIRDTIRDERQERPQRLPRPAEEYHRAFQVNKAAVENDKFQG